MDVHSAAPPCLALTLGVIVIAALAHLPRFYPSLLPRLHPRIRPCTPALWLKRKSPALEKSRMRPVDPHPDRARPEPVVDEVHCR